MSDSFKKELLFDLGLLLLIAAVFLGGFAYFRLEFGRFAEKRSDYSYIRPKRRTYVLTKAADYEQALAALPFAPTDS